MELPTVRIVSPASKENPDGYIVINESDFDAAVHKKWPQKPEAPAADPIAVAKAKKAAEDAKA